MVFKSIAFLVPFLVASWACRCAPNTQQGAFEAANIVAHVTVLSKQEVDDKLRYSIHYNETFKPNIPKIPHTRVPIPLPGQIETSASSASCGVDGLIVGQEYLVAGQRSGNTISINSCSGIPSADNEFSSPLGALDWSSVNAQLLGKLRSGFR